MSDSTAAFSATHIGQKLIKAIPMTRQEYNDFRGWALPENELSLGNDGGYMVEYEPNKTSIPNVEGFQGYISWSPKAVFDDAYKSLDAMSFGDAITMLKRGEKVARKGWNGKGMFLILVQADDYCYKQKLIDAVQPNSADSPAQLPFIAMKTSDNCFVPWLASQTDVLSEDWVIAS